MTDGKRFKLHPILSFSGIYLLLDTLIAMWFLFGAINIFRAILYIYLSNFVVLPAFGVIYFFVNLIRRKNNHANLAVLSISILLLSFFIYATGIEPRSLKIIEIDIYTDNIETELIIAHVSDIQSKSVGAYENKVFEKLAELKPDIVFHTGDLIQTFNVEDYKNQLDSLARLFKKLNPKYGVFNVIGNVDNELMMKSFDNKSEVKTLINRSTEIIGDGFELDVLGLSYMQSMEGDKEIVDRWLQKNNGGFTIILGHAPDYILSIMDSDVDLCLAGHTHGGQVNLPFIGALLNASETPKDWAKGFRKFNHIALNVSSGIGTEHAEGIPPIRFNCPPTITIFKIIGSKK